MNTLLTLDGKTAVVTGGGRGIGGRDRPGARSSPARPSS